MPDWRPAGSIPQLTAAAGEIGVAIGHRLRRVPGAARLQLFSIGLWSNLS